MASKVMLSLRVFGAGRGESILLILETNKDSPLVFVLDCYATKPYDSPETNPIIAIQQNVFTWDQVTAICLTHAHEDHFLGLESVASKTTNAKWVWPSGIPIDSVVDYYDKFAEFKRSPDSMHEPHRWFANSIRDLATWSKQQEPFQILSGRQLTDNHVPIQCVAPKDETASKYAGLLIKSFGDGLLAGNQAPPHDFHNEPSAGMLIDTKEGVRVLLLGDMVQDSWTPILKDGKLLELLSERKADILKLPHHCSNGATWRELLDLICDHGKTKAVFTPFRLKSPPPHDEAVSLVAEFVDELWCTVALPRASELWQFSSDNTEASLVLRDYFHDPQKCRLPPADCMLAFEVDSQGAVTSSPGKYAHRIK